MVASAGEDRPRLGNGVDLALLILVGAERRPIVVPGTAVPGAIPRVGGQGLVQLVSLLTIQGGVLRLAEAVAQGGKIVHSGAQEPAQPDAFAFALDPYPVHPVVPVAGTDQGQSMRATRGAPVQRTTTVFVERIRCPGRCVVRIAILLRGA